MDFNDVMHRVSLVIEKELKMKPKDNVIAKYLAISPTNFANLKSRNSIPYEEIIYFSAKYKVSANWIFFSQKCSSLVEEEEKYYSLKVINRINASCGGGSFEDDNIKISYIKLNKETLEKLGYSNSNGLEAIKVVGDSMYPTLKDKEFILIDKNKNKYNSSSVFLVNTTNGLFVKRLKINGDKIDLISDNKDYTILTLCVDEVTILGKVLGILESNEDKKDIINESNMVNNDEKLEDTKHKIDFYTAYVELVDRKYNFYRPEDDMQEGRDWYTDESLYSLKYNQFHAIVIKCKVYDNLRDNCILDIESEICVLFSESREEDDSYLFLFQDFYNFQYERAKLYDIKV
ncbi:S24 family peptidase [Aliarcobacter butzleri]|uniref:S24 family peptidase n=1 Tax=Aliarcobacter butzleri TaxID=28197 RepID=UPI002B243E1A|nr:S24 family peptidase [Aliarcobacter butzleri]